MINYRADPVQLGFQDKINCPRKVPNHYIIYLSDHIPEIYGEITKPRSTQMTYIRETYSEIHELRSLPSRTGDFLSGFPIAVS